LVLHGESKTTTNKIFKLNEEGPKIFSKDDMIKSGYKDPAGDLYIIYKIENEVSNEFGNLDFDLKELQNFKSFRNSPNPITVSLTELLKAKPKT
jgi:hypothetical protein